MQQFLAKHGTTQLQKPPYSPDLTPCDFFLFPGLKKVLKGQQFKATEDIKRNLTKTLLDIPKEEFAKCFQQWQKRWAKCVAVEGNYVEEIRVLRLFLDIFWAGGFECEWMVRFFLAHCSNLPQP